MRIENASGIREEGRRPRVVEPVRKGQKKIKELKNSNLLYFAMRLSEKTPIGRRKFVII